MKAFKPRKSIFMRVCMNCENGKQIHGVGGTPLGYVCVLKEGSPHLFATHECDVDIADDKDQINWFEEFKEKIDK